MTEQDGVEEALATVDYLQGLSKKTGAPLVIYLNPTYMARKSRLAERMAESGWMPPTVRSLFDVVLETARRGGPQDLPRAAEVSLGPLVLMTAFAVTVASALWLAGVQAVSQPSGIRTLLAAGAAGRGATRRGRLRGSMAAIEIAAAVVLPVGAGLILRSFTALVRVDPGFVPDSVLTFRVPFPFQEVSDAGGSGRATPFYGELAERLAGHPAVESVGYAKCTPLSRLCGLEGLTLQSADQPVGSAEHEELFGILQVGPGYHETLSMPLLAGRHLERGDHEQRTNAVVVSAAVAERLWPGADPLGRRLTTPDIPDWSPFTVVGVVAEVRFAELRGEPEAVVYIPVRSRRLRGVAAAERVRHPAGAGSRRWRDPAPRPPAGRGHDRRRPRLRAMRGTLGQPLSRVDPIRRRAHGSADLPSGGGSAGVDDAPGLLPAGPPCGSRRSGRSPARRLRSAYPSVWLHPPYRVLKVGYPPR